MRQTFNFRDAYTIDMSGDPEKAVDRRLILAVAVDMDALQARGRGAAQRTQAWSAMKPQTGWNW
jgi:hypothetical protein